MNDAEINTHCLKIRSIARKLSELQCGNSELALAIALSDIQRAAEEAQWRLNDLKPLPPLYIPPSKGPVSG